MVLKVHHCGSVAFIESEKERQGGAQEWTMYS